MPAPPQVPRNSRPRPEVDPETAALPLEPYAELHCKTNYSFLEGASHPDELVQRAAKLRYTALAITDRNSLAGVVRAHAAASKIGLKLLIGAEVHPVDGPPVVFLAMNRRGYGRLSTLITLGRRNAPKGECRLTIRDIASHAEGLLACVPFPDLYGLSATLLDGSTPFGLFPERLRFYREAFGDRCYLLAERHYGPDDQRQLAEAFSMASEAGVCVAAANDVHYHVPERQPLQDVLTATRHQCQVAELGRRRFSNGERHLKSPGQMRRLFAGFPQAIERTVEIAGRCNFSLDELRYEYPRELSPPGLTPMAYLERLTREGAMEIYSGHVPESVRQTIDRELELIRKLKYEAFFLTVWDIVRFARSRNILCQGRGSAANSVVCYCLKITSVDPQQVDLLFERFVSEERDEPPDIDVDFEHERREEVIQYLYEKYGRHRAGMAATLITYRPRSAIRDVGKALGLSADRVDQLAKTLDVYGNGEALPTRFREAGLDLRTRMGQLCLALTNELLGFPRHLSQHVGGMVITEGPLHELVPIENATMPGRTVIEWDKDDLDVLGLLKVDCLALGMLTAIRKSFDFVHKHHGRALTLQNVPQDDAPVYDMICRADTIGVFQIESRAQMSMLPRLRPERFYDLVIEVAIVRPGPIQGDMVHPYLEKRNALRKQLAGGAEAPSLPTEEKTESQREVETVLRKTLGVPLFQEQVMKLAIVAAGFSPGEADELRRAMAAWKKKGGLEKYREKLVRGMLQKGHSAEFAERIFKQICGFGDYGFPESHAASFARLAYVSAWIKFHYPAAFAAALINSQPMGFYAPAQLIADARDHGIAIRPVDVNHSDWDCTLEEPRSSATLAGVAPQPALRLGLRLIKGIPSSAAQTISLARKSGPFLSVEDFDRRTKLDRKTILGLARADAFASLELDRRAALWEALPRREGGSLLHASHEEIVDSPLAPMPPVEEVTADYRTTGLSLKAHPFSFLREWVSTQKAICASELKSPAIKHGQQVQVAGLVLLRQRPETAKGVTFMTLEDETGQVNLIVWKKIWERQRPIARAAKALLVTGEVQKTDEGLIHVVVRRMRDLSDQLHNIPNSSRDFR